MRSGWGKLNKILRLVRERRREQGLKVTFLWLLEHAVRITTGAPRMKTSQISPGLVVGGQYRRQGWPRIKAAGVTGVLNLRMEYCDRDAGIAPAAYLRLPTVDDEAPTVDQLEQGIAFIEDQMRKGGGVYVHCGAGVGRAATMAAAYLVAQGLQPEEAWARIRRVRPFIRPTLQQRKAIDEWAERGRRTASRMAAASGAAAPWGQPVKGSVQAQT